MKKWIENQFPNQFLYLPFLMAFGAGLYFCNSTEINLIYSISLFIIAVVGIFCGKLPIVLRGLCIFIFGFCYASLFTHIINTPQIPHNMDIIELVGTVQDIDYTYDKNRILLSVNGNDIHTDIGGAKAAGLSTFYMHTNLTPPDQRSADPQKHPDVYKGPHWEYEGYDWVKIAQILGKICG